MALPKGYFRIHSGPSRRPPPSCGRSWTSCTVRSPPCRPVLSVWPVRANSSSARMLSARDSQVARQGVEAILAVLDDLGKAPPLLTTQALARPWLPARRCRRVRKGWGKQPHRQHDRSCSASSSTKPVKLEIRSYTPSSWPCASIIPAPGPLPYDDELAVGVAGENDRHCLNEDPDPFPVTILPMKEDHFLIGSSYWRRNSAGSGAFGKSPPPSPRWE